MRKPLQKFGVKVGYIQVLLSLKGLRQGCFLSSLIFSLFLNDLPDVLALTLVAVAQTQICIDDDIILLTVISTGLQYMIHI